MLAPSRQLELERGGIVSQTPGTQRGARVVGKRALGREQRQRLPPVHERLDALVPHACRPAFVAAAQLLALPVVRGPQPGAFQDKSRDRQELVRPIPQTLGADRRLERDAAPHGVPDEDRPAPRLPEDIADERRHAVAHRVERIPRAVRQRSQVRSGNLPPALREQGRDRPPRLTPLGESMQADERRTHGFEATSSTHRAAPSDRAGARAPR